MYFTTACIQDIYIFWLSLPFFGMGANPSMWQKSRNDSQLGQRLWNITLMSYQHAWNYITREGIYFAYKDLGNSKQKIIPQKNIDGAVQVSCSCCIPQAAPGHTIAAFPLVINIGRTSQSGAWPPSLWLKTTFSFRFHRHDMWLFLGFANAR